MRNATLMKEVFRFSTQVLGEELMNKFTHGITKNSSTVGRCNPNFEKKIDWINYNFAEYNFTIRKSFFGVEISRQGNDLPDELNTEILLAAAIAAEEILGVHEGVMDDSGVRIAHEPQERTDDGRYIRIYFPHSMKDYGPQEQDLRAVAMLNFARPLMEAIIQTTEREIRKWNLRQRKGV